MAKKAILVAVALTVLVVGYYLTTDDAPVREDARTGARTVEERRQRRPESEPDREKTTASGPTKVKPSETPKDSLVERRVVDDRGNPVPYVQVVAVTPADFGRPQRYRADAEGRVRLPRNARVAIVTYHQGVEPLDFEKTADSPVLTFRGIAGRLIDEKDKPVERGLIVVRQEGETKIFGYADLTTDGRFALYGLDEGNYRLSHKTSRSGVETTTIDGGRDVPHWQTDVALRLRRGDTIEGIVFDENGLPKKSVWVRTTIGTTLTGAYTDKEGRFIVKGVDPTQTYRLTTWLRGYVPEIIEDVRPGTKDVRFTLDPGLRSTGRVLDAEGKPLVYAEVKVRPASGRSLPLYPKTDKQGNFELKGLPDEEIQITVRRETFRFRAGDRDLVFQLAD